MNKYWIIGLIVLVALVMIFRGGQEVQELEIKEVCYEDDCFIVEIADSESERAKGLMHRESLCDDCGMLFIYEEEGDYKFWMKNTLIPLDIIWLDSDLRVIHIADAVPCVKDKCENYGPNLESLYILEINSGKSSEIGLEVGDSLEFVFTPKVQ